MTKPLQIQELFNPFKHWVNTCPELDSRIYAITVGDVDNVVFHDSGQECLIMLVETKSKGQEHIEDSQKNIYAVIDAVFRFLPPVAKQRPIAMKLWGRIEVRRIRYLGTHLLVLEQTTPDDSLWMKWDGQPINREQLIQVLRFKLDPQNLAIVYKEPT